MKQTHTTADPEHHVSNTKNNTITLNTPTLSTLCAGSPTAVLPLWKALLSEEDRSMWSNVEVCSQMGAGHTHLEEWGGKDDGTVQWGGGGDKHVHK